MGLGGVPYYVSIPPLPNVSQVVSDAGWIEETTLPPAIDRRDVTSNEEVVPDVAYVVDDPQTYINRTVAGQQVVWAGSGPAPQIMGPSVPQTIMATEEDDVSWIEDVYDTVDTALGGWLPGGVPVGSSMPQTIYNQPIGGAGPTPVPMPPPVQPQMPGAVTLGACDTDPMKGMVWKKHCGTWRWVKQKRRRRRKLVSQSDAQGLSTLIAILGNGKATQAWIATHAN